ncbi:MAG: protein translocase subunit SecD [Bacillota bacterium]
MRTEHFWRFLILAAILAAGAFIIYYLPINLGLDLRGGILLNLDADTRVDEEVLRQVGADFWDKFVKNQIAMENSQSVDKNREGILFDMADEEGARDASKLVPREYTWKSESGIKKELILKPVVLSKDPTKLRVIVDEVVSREKMDSAKTIVEQRINGIGVKESQVRLIPEQNRIQVQAPGYNKPQELEAVLGRTGKLTFRDPLGVVVLEGEHVKDAQVAPDQEHYGYCIEFQLDDTGSKIFDQYTGSHIRQKLAIYLDEEMLMDPVIESRIPNGQGRITMGQDNNSYGKVSSYAQIIKAGAMPVALKTVSSQKIDPSLGAKVIQTSKWAVIIGGILVLLYMIVCYLFPGTLADFALLVYATGVLAVMALFRFVLTLPGIAGFILSVGMAVDANVIIFERIKEELKLGKRLRSAIGAGFERSWSTIIDSNITTLITAFCLFIFGTGPVKGFSVTLSVGIVISMITAIAVTRLFIDAAVDKNPDRFARLFGHKGGAVQ